MRCVSGPEGTLQLVGWGLTALSAQIDYSTMKFHATKKDYSLLKMLISDKWLNMCCLRDID